MLTIIYDPINGQTCPDYEIVTFCENVLSNYVGMKEVGEESYAREIGSELLITQFRVMVAEGKIPCDDIEIKFEDKIIKISEIGSIVIWPKGFCDTYSKCVVFLGRIRRANK